MKYCFLDLETTGLEHEKDSIIEVSFIITDQKLQELDRLDEVIIPHKTPLIPFVTSLTGITQSEIDAKGKSWGSVKEMIQNKLEGTIIIGHNIDFDIHFLQENGINLDAHQRIDTHELARILFPEEESYSLEAISYKRNIEHANAHRAMADVEACIQLWPLLIEKLKSLPREAIPLFDTIWEKTKWTAKQLFVEFCGTSDINSFSTKNTQPQYTTPLPEIDAEVLQRIQNEQTTFVQAGNTGQTARWMTQLAHKSTGPFLIIAPELSFFSEIEQLPTPSVIFDRERHQLFALSRKQLSDRETVFYVQCAVRHWLGFRGMKFFDLFLHQRDLWKEVCLLSTETPVFQKILEERMSQKVLTCTPAAWAELCDLPIVKNRTLIVFEAEIFAEKMLFAATKSISLMKWLDEEETSNATHFFVARFVREELERLLGRQISGFPEKELLPAGGRYPEFATAAREISPELEELAQWLETPEEELVRWSSYFPGTGNLVFGTWKKKDWLSIRQNFQEQKSIICTRHNGGDSNAFCRVFLGQQEGYWLTDVSFGELPSVTIPQGLVSSKSPEFNGFCQQKITEIAEENTNGDHWMAVSFSSLASLKNVGTALLDSPPKNCSVLGEKLSGGDSKLMGNIAKQEQVVLLLQKLQNPVLEKFPFKTFIIQKFPFVGTHPLYKHLEKEWKSNQMSFWDNWTIPTVAARLARTVGQFPHLQNIILLDPAENTPWGKEILSQAFPKTKPKKLF